MRCKTVNGYGALGRTAAGCAVAVLAGGIQSQAEAQPSNAKFVNNVYRDLLLRPARPEEISANVYRLAHGNTRYRILSDIERLRGHRAEQSRRAYTMFLRRQPTQTEQTAGIAFLTSGGRLEHLESQVVGTHEYFVNQGGGTNAGFLNQACLDFCGHTIKGGELDARLGQLGLGQSRTSVAREMINSEDSLGMQVDMWYRKYMNRYSYPDEYRAWIDELSSGTREEVIIGNIMATPEYYYINNL